MEKAFDRVSYEFTKRGLDAYDFGHKFRKWVGMMHDETSPPKRRMYVNGYYSEWFPILSGVAQGCPLSPLLFLIVAEALKSAIDMQPGIKGITIRDIAYKLSQFADDTTIILGTKAEINTQTKPYKIGATQRECENTWRREKD